MGSIRGGCFPEGKKMEVMFINKRELLSSLHENLYLVGITIFRDLCRSI